MQDVTIYDRALEAQKKGLYGKDLVDFILHGYSCHDKKTEHIQTIHRALSLMNCMIYCREEHSETSKKALEDAKKSLNYLHNGEES